MSCYPKTTSTIKLLFPLLLLVLLLLNHIVNCKINVTTEKRWLHVPSLKQFSLNPKSMSYPVKESASPFHTTTMVTPYDSVSRPPFNHDTFFNLFNRYRDSTTPWPSPFNKSSHHDGKVNRNTRNIVPTFVSTFLPDQVKVAWKAPCFQNNVGWLSYNQAKKAFTFTFQSSNATSYLCTDWYLFASRETFHIKAVAWRGTHTLTMVNLLPSDINAIMNMGLAAFVFEDGLLGTMIDAYVAARTIYGVYFEKDKKTFLANNMDDFPFDLRPYPNTPIMNTTYISNGDLLGVVTLSGLDVILMYGTGSHIGHVATALWIPNEKSGELELFVVEALDGGIKRTHYAQWIASHIAEDQVVILGKLKKEYAKQLDAKKAVDFFLESEHLPYGYQNIAFAWIDTIAGNYPTPLDEHMIPSVLTIFGKLSEKWLDIMFLQGLNQRIQNVYGKKNITCTSMTCICETADELNITVQELISIPEQDDWVYPPHNTKAMVCSVFIMSMYKAAGLFSDLEISASEFTPKDLYMLDLWDKDWKRPPECLKNNDNYPYCQMLGRWYWPLPEYAAFGVLKPYSHMNEKCEAIPPNYPRGPDRC